MLEQQKKYEIYATIFDKFYFERLLVGSYMKRGHQCLYTNKYEDVEVKVFSDTNRTLFADDEKCDKCLAMSGYKPTGRFAALQRNHLWRYRSRFMGEVCILIYKNGM